MKKPELHVSFDPYREDGSGSITIATDGGFITKDSREVWDIIKKDTNFLKSDKTPYYTFTSGTIDTSEETLKLYKEIIKDSKYNIDTKWLEETNE